MVNWFDAVLNGRSLAAVDDAILILDINEAAPQVSINASPNAKYDGMHVTDFVRQSLEVEITLQVRERSPERRARVMDKLQEWARDGELKVNYRPHQVLRCVRTGLPGIGSAWNWTDSVRIAFTAYAVPYWQAEQPAAVYITRPTTDGRVSIQPAGTAEECFLQADVVQAGTDDASYLQLTCAETGTFIRVEGLAWGPGGHIIIDYDTDGYIGIHGASGVSVMSKRTAASHDDIVLKQRMGNTIRMQSDRPCTAVFKARGLYL